MQFEDDIEGYYYLNNNAVPIFLHISAHYLRFVYPPATPITFQDTQGELVNVTLNYPLTQPPLFHAHDFYIVSNAVGVYETLAGDRLEVRFPLFDEETQTFPPLQAVWTPVVGDPIGSFDPDEGEPLRRIESPFDALEVFYVRLFDAYLGILIEGEQPALALLNNPGGTQEQELQD